jgi:hypothetical protein
MSLVQRIRQSPMLQMKAPGSAGASSQVPSRRRTCRPATPSVASSVTLP